MILKNYKHIIWDWNGTIFNDVDLCISVVNNLLKKYSLPLLTRQRYLEIFTFPVEDYYTTAGFDLTTLSFQSLGREWMDEYETRKFEASVFPDVIDKIKSIHKAGVGQSILTAYSHEDLISLLNHFSISKYFTDTAGLDHIYATSKIDIGKELLNRIGFNGKSVLLIGDTLHDKEVAKELGIDCLLISRGHQSKERLTHNHTFVVDKISDIPF